MKYIEITELITKVVLKDETCDFKDELWSRIEAHCMSETMAPTLSLYRNTVLWRLAASVILVLAVGFGAYLFSKKTYTATDSVLTITLPDHSTVKLHPGSLLQYNRIGWLLRHDVSLDGKALFDGEHAAGFRVITSKGTIDVLGTCFLVDEANTSLQVDCFSGSIMVATPKGNQLLREGERIVYSHNTMQVSKVKKQWSEYEHFDNGSLKDALRLIEEIYEIEINDDERYGEYSYSGVIPTSNLDEALELVLGSCDITYMRSGKEIIIR